jgi:polysaccharide export outer membrane protein
MNRRSQQLAILSAALVALAGCAGRGGSVPYAPAGFGLPDQVTVQTVDGSQTIVPRDKLKVTVFQEPEVSGEFEVNSAGKIDYPLLGLLDVQGLTAPELSELIRARLASSYLRDPKVQVAVSEAAERTITVEGAVGQSGVYPIEGPTTLIRAIALARGTSKEANDSRVVVFRTIAGQRQAAAFDLDAIRRAEADDPPIYGNDVVVVPGSKSYGLWREFLSSVPILGIFRPF